MIFESLIGLTLSLSNQRSSHRTGPGIPTFSRTQGGFINTARVTDRILIWMTNDSQCSLWHLSYIYCSSKKPKDGRLILGRNKNVNCQLNNFKSYKALLIEENLLIEIKIVFIIGLKLWSLMGSHSLTGWVRTIINLRDLNNAGFEDLGL